MKWRIYFKARLLEFERDLHDDVVADTPQEALRSWLQDNGALDSSWEPLVEEGEENVQFLLANPDLPLEECQKLEFTFWVLEWLYSYGWMEECHVVTCPTCRGKGEVREETEVPA